CDLLGAPLRMAKERLDAAVGVGVMLPDLSTAPTPAVGAFLCLARPIGAVGPMATVALDLTADRTGRAAQEPGKRPQGLPVAVKHGQGVSFWLGELVVHEGSSLAGVIPSSLPAHLSIFWRRGCCT